MRPNVKQFVRLLTEAMDFPGPILDAGSMHTEGQEQDADLRPFFAGARYLGVDMRPGPGVDALASVHHLPVRAGTAGSVLVLDTLEHVLDPIAAMREVCSAVGPGGIVVASSHMNFPVHAHPSDYWRFTPMAFDHLLGPLATRFVFLQGDAENPHTVVAAGMKASPDGSSEVAFRAAIRQVQARWPDESYGGPLVLHEPLAIDLSQRSSEFDLPELIAGRVIEQTFTCTHDGLSRIDIKMSNRSGENLRHVLFQVYEAGQPEHVLAAYRVLGWHVGDDSWLAVPVPVQARSAGKRYVIAVESPDGVPGNTVSVKGTKADIAGMDLRIGGLPQSGSIAFQTYCWGSKTAHGDVQTGEEFAADLRPALPAAALNGFDAKLAALNEQNWEQVRYLASQITSGLDAIREQIRADHAAMLDLQQRTLEASTEKLLARSLRDNPVARALRGRGPGKKTRPDPGG